MRRTFSAFSVFGVLVALLLVPVTPAHAATARQPILFVHGYDSSGATWDTMVDNFKANGYADAELFPISYNSSQQNSVTAQELVGIVEDIQAQTGWATIDIVTHSMGGLSSRYYLKNLGGTSDVDEWVSLGGPNHGTNTARFCFDKSCKDMRRGSPFLTSLNSGDETPGPIRYGTWKSPCDIVINPDSSVALTGATNTTTACLGHSDLQNNSTVFGQVLAFVQG